MARSIAGASGGGFRIASASARWSSTDRRMILGFLYGAVRGLLGSGDDEVADAAPLDLGGAFHDGERVGRDLRFEPGGAGRFLGHHRGPLVMITLYGN